jgi:hypothetical protein
VKEQSHKDEMSRALRGDFERLRERGVSSTLTQPEPPAAPPAPVETEAPPGGTPAGIPAEDAGDAPRAGLLSRLLGR